MTEKEKFVSYSSIENSYRERFVNSIKNTVPKEETWIILEKIHGCSVQIYYDKDGFRYGKRNSFINGSFYNSHNVLPKYEEKIKKIYEEYKKPIRIFGELFGGLWDGKVLEMKVMKGVEYSKYIDAIFYDMMIGDKIIPYMDTCMILFEQKIPYLKPLSFCSLDDALKFPNKFPSTIPKNLYGLPTKKDNICEGIVIKSYEHEYITPRGSRAILKSKNKKFAEKQKVGVVKINIELTEDANKLIAILESYITENRFNSVLSKENYGKKDFGIFIGKFARDVFKDAENDEVDLNKVDKVEMSRVNKLMNKKIVEVCKDLFFKQAQDVHNL